MHPLHEQLQAAWEREKARVKGSRQRRTREWLIKKAGLKCDSTSLSRKLNGKQVITAEECEAIARALGVHIEFGRDRQATGAS